jgi:hypothetical protein
MILSYIYWIGILCFFLWMIFQLNQDNKNLRRCNPYVKPMSAFSILVNSIALSMMYGSFWPIAWPILRRAMRKERSRYRERNG